MKKIPVSDLRLGMFIQELCGSWMDHPFWENSFLLESEDDLRTLKNGSIQEVWINPARGLDARQSGSTVPPGRRQVRAQADALLQKTPGSRPPEAWVSLRGEMDQARRLRARAREAVASMFSEVRLGKVLQTEQAYPVVDEIHCSIARNSDALLSLVRLKNKDDYTYLHSVAVCALMIALGKRLGLEGDDLRHAGLAGLLHDVGKMMIPDRILNKAGKLTDDEFEIIKSHPGLGHETLLRAGNLDDATLEVCLHHHERMDGKGYPDRIAGENLSLYARMGAICDVYDAITSERCYKKSWEPALAVHKMAEWQEGHFDLKIFHTFVRTVGIYPVGSLVRLKSGRLGFVVEQGALSLITPIVEIVFPEPSHAPTRPEIVDLSRDGDSIVSSEDPQQWGLRPPF